MYKGVRNLDKGEVPGNRRGYTSNQIDETCKKMKLNLQDMKKSCSIVRNKNCKLLLEKIGKADR